MSEVEHAALEMGWEGADSGRIRLVTRATPCSRQHSSEHAVTMPTTTDSQRCVGARANAREHFVMSASDAKRTNGSAWNSRLVSGTVRSVHEDDSGKCVSEAVTAVRDLPAGRKLHRVNVRYIAAGRPPELLEQRRTSLRRPLAMLGTPTLIETVVAVTGPPLLTLVQAHRHRPTGPTISSTRPRRWRTECFGKRRTCCSPWAGTYRTDCGRRRPLPVIQSSRARTLGRPYDYFMAVFPPDQLVRMVELTNDKLATKKQPQLTTGELLKFFGVLILGTRYEFGHRADLWKTEAGNRLLQAPAFGMKTGMPRKRFDAIWSSLTFSRQGDRGDEECSAAHRWRLVSEFVESINSHRSAHFSPSELICVDESIARWYGQGGRWMEHGLPQYVAIDRKPEDGCETQKSACGRSGIMMQPQAVPTVEHEETRASEAEACLKHGTAFLDRLVRPWYGKGDRIVCADSYFAGVEAALHLQARGVRCIGLVKTATSRYLMKLLQSKVLPYRGDWATCTGATARLPPWPWCGTNAGDGTLSPLPPASRKAPCARVIRRVNKPALSRRQANDRAQKAVLSPPCSLPESKDVYSPLEIPKYSGPGPRHQYDTLQAAAAPARHHCKPHGPSQAAHV
jgi:hypothetical protein